MNVNRMGLGLLRGVEDGAPIQGYRNWAAEMGFKTWDQLSGPMYGGDLPRVRSAMRVADELHFNMEGFRPPSSPTLGVQYGEPLGSYTNFEYSLMRTQYQGKSFFWLGGKPYTGPHPF